MAEDYDDDELPSVDHGPLNEGPWEKYVRKYNYFVSQLISLGKVSIPCCTDL